MQNFALGVSANARTQRKCLCVAVEYRLKVRILTDIGTSTGPHGMTDELIFLINHKDIGINDKAKQHFSRHFEDFRFIEIATIKA